MSVVYVLMIFSVHYAQHVPAISEFNSLQACENAKKVIAEIQPYKYRMVCIPKG
jgi:hypothetical protein